MSSKIKIEIRAILHDKNGRPTKKLPWKKANSLIKQFIRILAVQLSQITDPDIKYTAGGTLTVPVHATNLNASGGLNQTIKSIVIGTGTDAVAMDDYKLQNQVETNVLHSVDTWVVDYPSASQARITVSRTFTNNTGSILGIKEVGLYALALGAGPFCIERTLYSVDVPDAVPVTLTYRITISL